MPQNTRCYVEISRSRLAANYRAVCKAAGPGTTVMGVVKAAVDAVAARAPRVSVTLKADIRPGVTGGLVSKVESLERHLTAD